MIAALSGSSAMQTPWLAAKSASAPYSLIAVSRAAWMLPPGAVPVLVTNGTPGVKGASISMVRRKRAIRAPTSVGSGWERLGNRVRVMGCTDVI